MAAADRVEGLAEGLAEEEEPEGEPSGLETGETETLQMEGEGEALLCKQRQGGRGWGRKIAKKTLHHVKANLLLLLTILGVALGIILGVLVSLGKPSDLVQTLVSFPGEIFLRALKMLILPLIIFSLMSGLGSLKLKTAGALGFRTLLYYMTTTLLAVTLGIILVVTIQPGKGNTGSHCTNVSLADADANSIDVVDAMLDLIRNIVPDNLFLATFSQTRTEYSSIIDYTACAESLGFNWSNQSNASDPTNLSCRALASLLEGEDCTVKRVSSIAHVDGMNILGVITFTIAFSIILSTFGSEAEGFLRVISVLNEAIMKLITLIMWTSPVGIASIIAGKLLEVDSLTELVEQLGLYMVCVIVGLIIHSCITLPIMYTVFTCSNPLKLVRGCLQALLVAFGTSSSSATLPVTLTCLEDNMRYDKRVTRFMIPVGATINMDGTALYEAVAAVFIAQANDSSLGFDKILLVAITATLASIGAAGVPQAGLVTLIIVLTAIGLPPEEAALILTVDWFLDRLRTMVNVFGDCVGVGIVSRFSRKQLEAESEATSRSSPVKTEDNKQTLSLDAIESETESSRL